MNINNKIIPLGLIVAVASVFLPMSVQSEEIPVRGPINLSAYDQDNSGFITEEEFNAIREKRMDANAAQGRPMLGAAGAPSFAALDLNADGELTQDELAAGQQAQMNKRREMGMGQGQGMGNCMGMGQGMGMGMGRNMPSFSDYDLNGDRQILEDEFNAARSQRIDELEQQGYLMRNQDNAPRFDDIDVNGNGEISAEEFAAHQSQRRQNSSQ